MPQPDVQALTTTAIAMKSSLEILTGVTKHAAVTYSNLDNVTYNIDAYITKNGALVEQLSEIIVDTTGTTASLQTQVSTLDASVTTNSTAISQLDGIVSARYSITLNVNNKITGISLLADNSGASTFDVVADNFNIWATGYANQPVFQVSTIGGVAQLTINGHKIGDLSVQNNGLNNNAATNGSTSSGPANSGVATVTVRAGARVVINATYKGGDAVTTTIYRAGTMDIVVNDPTGGVTTYSFIIGAFFSSPLEFMTGTSAVVPITSAPAGSWSAYAHTYVPSVTDLTSGVTVVIQEFSK